MAGRASGIKMVRMVEVGEPISLDGIASIWIVGASAFVIFPLYQKTKKMEKKQDECAVI